MDSSERIAFNGSMTRCNSCNGIIAKTDLECYTCQEPVPGKPRPGRYSLLRFLAKPAMSALKDFVAGEAPSSGTSQLLAEAHQSPSH